MRLTFTAGVSTPRLRLRPWRADEGGVLLDLLGREDVNRFLYTAPRGPGDLDALLRRRVPCAELCEVGAVAYLAVQRLDTGTVVGEVLLILRSVEHRGAEFGAVFHPDHHGHGFAVEAGRALLTAGFAQGLHRIYARSDVRNTPSVALMSRLGMRTEAHFVQNEFVKGVWTDEIRCAVLADEYRGS